MNKEEKIDQLLTRGVSEVLPSAESLKVALQGRKKLKIYIGIDPTSPMLHIGHAIGLRKLREFQDLGHEVILLLGSFTAMIGDPTDKTAVRTQLTQKEVLKNAVTYKEQAGKILNFEGKNPVKLMFNHKWLQKMNFSEVVNLASHFTVQQMLERDMFETRIKEGKPVYVHEFMYPLMQGYDSVAMDVDAEIGGSDQTFNMLAGRTLQRQINGREKFVITMKLLENAEGKKMSKSEGGFIALNDSAKDIFGKLMAMDDSMILPYMELASDYAPEEIAGARKQLALQVNPREIKAELAERVSAMYHGKKEARKAREGFDKVFKAGETPEDIELKKLVNTNIIDVLIEVGFASSKSEARRLVDQNSVKLDGVVITSYEQELQGLTKEGNVLQKGKRHFVKIKNK
ncbi:tyrosine--tRNA ligase [Candidatus Uhrbacteria bacterium CG_4_9_14_3_um_filter_41_35]|uniref:Tyrosine--tRNA ligase n=1 Tax=Candidatus Uhrbacteria bacterium CG_4_9_14_3_um_filter_41_35 TaxID=1975034 RepID=A0A2M7XGB9_9BACT|nr:MAG: tyrosine--tRNA ligase [Candidatus Uhrbacteria bacterium CG_4_9_14_3_um_filter_41_35]